MSEIRLIAQELRRQDPGFQVFGAGGHFGHHYEIRPPLSETEVIAFERQHGLELPGDYRQFITQISDGGMGPYYGLKRLQEAAGPGVARPFRWESESQLTDKDDDFWDLQPGYLYLADIGCGAFFLLIVKGCTYGLMWSYDTSHTILPLEQTFSMWFRLWAEQKLRLIARKPLLGRVSVGMPLPDVISLLGPAENTWSSNLNTGLTYASFQDIPASIEFDDNDRVLKVNHLPL